MSIRPILAVALALAAGGWAAAQQQATPPTGAEEAPVRSAFERADANSDGKLSKEEAALVPAIAARFEQFDRDRDGLLSLEEFSAGYTAGS